MIPMRGMVMERFVLVVPVCGIRNDPAAQLMVREVVWTILFSLATSSVDITFCGLLLESSPIPNSLGGFVLPSLHATLALTGSLWHAFFGI